MPGQQPSLTATVLPGVSVRVKATSGGTLTAADGSFSLQLPDGPVTLVFSFTGYQPHEVNVAGSAPLNIILQPAAGELNEVVAVGYGQQKKTSLTGSVASLDQKALANRPITNSSQALQGLPGVYVNQVQGRPGADGEVEGVVCVSAAVEDEGGVGFI